MRKLLSSIALILTGIQLLRAQPIFFEKYIDFATGKEDFICNHTLNLISVNGLLIEVEPYASAQKGKLVVNGFSVYLPEDLSGWKGRKPLMELETVSGNKIRFSRSIYDKANQELFFYLTRETFQQLIDEPIVRLTLSTKKNTLTSREFLTRYEHYYFADVLDQFAFQIYDFINWLNPYYYDE
jgi:hypothetical protein